MSSVENLDFWTRVFQKCGLNATFVYGILRGAVFLCLFWAVVGGIAVGWVG
jgi:hypothetical protein